MPALSEPTASGPENLGITLVRFSVGLCNLAYYRAEKAELTWGSEGARRLARSIAKFLPPEKARTLFSNDSLSQLPHSIFAQEMDWFVANFTQIPKNDDGTFAVLADPATNQPPQGDPFAKNAVDAAETVKGSLDSLVKRLPKWLRKTLDVAMEIAKLGKIFAPF